MEGRKEHYLKDIYELLTILESNLRLNGKNHYFDLHSGSEDPICGLVSMLFGYQLINLNNEKMNYPGIDLADYTKRVAIQITTDGTRDKVCKTLQTFNQNDIRAAFDRLIIIIMGKKPAYRKPFDTRGLVLEIFSLDDISRKIAILDEAKVESIACYLRSAFVFRNNGATPQFSGAYADEESLIEQLPVLQENYLQRFRNVLIRGADNDLSLEDLYIPNPYVLGHSSEPRDDLFDLIDHFVHKKMSEWMTSGTVDDDLNTLLVEGPQCTGKSTLVASILSRAFFQWRMPSDKVHLLSFSERELRNIKLTARNISTYLNLDSEKQLRNALVIIDAFDESDWPSQDARRQLENLIDDLIKYRCKLIVTTRKNYLDPDDFPDILSITLWPFSLRHAERWLDVYATSNTALDVASMKSDLRSIPEELSHVILLPHVLQICVTHGIALGSVVNLNQLYNLVFRGPEGLFLRDQYFPNPRLQHQRLRQMLGTAVQISIQCMQQDNLISTQDLQAYITSGGPQMERLKTEYLLERREGGYYAFAHKTIPSYLIALDVYEAFSTQENSLPDHELLKRIAPVVTTDGVLSGDVIQSLEEMSNKDEPIPGNRAEQLLQRFLTDGIEADILKLSGQYNEAEVLYETWFDALVRLVLALKASWRNSDGEYRFFETLSPAAEKRFRMFFNRNKTEYRSWDYIRHSMLDNCTLNGLDLGKTNMQLKRIRAVVMHGAKFESTNLRGSYILDSDMSAACFDEASCTGVQFSNSVLCSTSFRKARLRGAWFIDCDLSHADLRDADLSKVRFINCVLNAVKITAQQLHDFYALFDLETILHNGIKLYVDDCELPKELVADEYRRQRPVLHSIRHNKDIFSSGSIEEAEMVQREIENHSGSISCAQIMEACPSISQSTVQRVLKNLLQNGQISKVGGGRHTAYIWKKK